MALTTAVNPQTNETVVLVDGAWAKADQVAVNPKDQSKAYLVSGKWMTDTGTADLPQPKASPLAPSSIAKDVGGVMETSANVGSGILATPIAGLAGLAVGGVNRASNLFGGKDVYPAADAVRNTQAALTYDPVTERGKKFSGVVGEGLSYLSEKPGEFAGEKTRALAQKMGASPEVSAAAGATVKTGVETIPQTLLGHGVGLGLDALRAAPKAAGAGAGAAEAGTGGAAPGAANAAGRAQAYVANLGLDWSKLSKAFQEKLTGVAADAQSLGKLNPEAVRRQATLASVGIDNPTRGQVSREPLQQRTEQTLKATEAGADLRALDVEHNAKLLEGVENLRKKVTAEQLPTTGSKSRGDLPVGRSVQDTALRAKAKASEKNVDRLYKKARETEPNATVTADAMYDLLQKNPHIQHLGWVQSWLKRAKVETEGAPGPDGQPAPAERRGITLNEINDLRQEANGVIKGGGTDAHYASQVKAAIDETMQQVPEGAKAWKEAIGAARKHFQEFKDQTAVRNLVEDKPHTDDRRMAIEETAKKTVTGKLEDLQKVKRSLLTGKDPAARAAGKTAWRDIKGWGLDYIRERMTKGVKNEAGDQHTTWVGLKRALDDIGDENLDELYGPSVRKQLRRFQEASEILFTEASTRVKGSPTLDKVLTFIDRVGGWTGYVGHAAAGVAKGVAKVVEVGEGAREVKDARSTTLDDQLTASRRSVRRSQNLSTVKKYQDAAAPAATQRPPQ